MDKLLALKTLVEVAETGGFSSAARRLGVATSSVTRLMDALEQSLGTALLTRTTRQVLLTDAGTSYLEQVTRLLADLEEADSSIADGTDELAGPLRIAVPATYSRLCLAPHLSAFMQAHPGIALDIVVNDTFTDLAVERIDLAVRIGVPERDENLVVKPLADNPRFLVAGPAYLGRRGTPASPDELESHACLRFAYGTGRQRWNFRAGKETLQIAIDGPLITTSLDMLHEAALRNHGIALLPQWLVDEELQNARLKRLLEAWDVTPQGRDAHVYAAYLPNRRHSRKVRTLLAFLEHGLAPGPEA